MNAFYCKNALIYLLLGCCRVSPSKHDSLPLCVYDAITYSDIITRPVSCHAGKWIK